MQPQLLLLLFEFKRIRDGHLVVEISGPFCWNVRRMLKLLFVLNRLVVVERMKFPHPLFFLPNYFPVLVIQPVSVGVQRRTPIVRAFARSAMLLRD